MRTICEALAKAACQTLEVETGEILAEYRPALNEAGATGSLIEVFLYDTLAGGAGFAPQLAARGNELFTAALAILEDCPEDCDASCYRCLRSFRNKLDHALLDRYVGAQLLRHVLTGETSQFSLTRARRSLSIVADDLDRQFADHFDVIRAIEPGEVAKAPIILRRRADGSEVLIDLHSPVAPGVAVFGTDDPKTVLLDDLMVRRHLGEVIEKIASVL
jgi:hypothetical protein